MSGYNSANDASKGSPNLEALQFLSDQLIDKAVDNQFMFMDKVSIKSSATGGLAFENIPVGAEIVDVVAHSTATVTSATAQIAVGDGGAAITDAIDIDTEDTSKHAATIDQTYKVVGADGIVVKTVSAADRADVYVFYRK